MEFTKDIYFDNSLKNGNIAKITYVGDLYKNGSEHINLVCGFGENWDNTSTIPMKKTKDGFVAEIEIQDYDTFNFCFSNENNCWDNNNTFNYVSPILPKPIESNPINFEFEFDSLEKFMHEIELEQNAKPIDDSIEFGVDYSTSIDDIIEDILGNTLQNSMANDAEDVNDILNTISEEPIPEIEALFNELFFEESNEVDKVETETVQDFVTTEVANNEELIELFNELFNNTDAPTYIEETDSTLNVAAFNLDGLVSDLLEPVISAPVNFSTEDSLFDNQETNTITEETALVAVSNELQVSSRRLGTFYKFKKRISLACYKLFVKLPRELAKQLGFYIDE